MEAGATKTGGRVYEEREVDVDGKELRRAQQCYAPTAQRASWRGGEDVVAVPVDGKEPAGSRRNENRADAECAEVRTAA